jgi:pilus assembly protein CpaB
MIPSGMRAIAVRVNEVVGVAGFVLPGMRVDVLLTGRPPGRDDPRTTTVLEQILVLSAGQTIQADAKAQSIATPVVTLLVTPEQAEVLTLANNEGKIQLVLRNTTDERKAAPPGRDLRQLFQLPAAALPLARSEEPAHTAAKTRPTATPRPPPPVQAAPPSAPPPAPGPDNEVVLIRGAQKTVETVLEKEVVR